MRSSRGSWSATSTEPTTSATGPHQRCWTHPGRGRGQALLRDIHQLKERFPEHEGLAQWSQKVREVYDQAQA